MRLLKSAAVLALLFVGSAHATVRYTNARISEIETSEGEIYLFLEVLSGDAPPTGNAGTNLPPDRPYLMLATTATEILNRKHMVAAALTAHSTGATVRIRWDDAGATPNRVEYFLLQN